MNESELYKELGILTNAYVKKDDKQYEFKYSDDLHALNKELSLSDEG